MDSALVEIVTPYIVGLTGGIACGKSTVAALFSEHQIPVIDADEIAQQLVLPGEMPYQSIVNHFGKAILTDSATINRSKLRQLIFNHPAERLWLEQLLHPLIRERMLYDSQNLKTPYCLQVIPLLVETLPHPELDRILIVDVSRKTQIKRLQDRDQNDPELIERILRSQASRTSRLKHADDIIKNEGDLNHLKKQVENLHLQYLQKAKLKDQSHEKS